MPFGIQPWHLVVIFIVALIIFGPSKLPELGRTIGKTINEFRTGAREMTETMKEEITKNEVRPVEVTPAAPVTPPAPAGQQAFSDTAAAPASTGNFCTNCGTANPADARFCKNCGNSLQV